MKRTYSLFLSIILLLSMTSGIFADVKIRQRVTMSGQTFETTKMIKGARQRTEQKSGAGGAMDFMSQVATIEQCDLRRTVQVNDSKKLYFVQPFAEESTPQKATPANRQTNRQTRQGGTITMTYNVVDTGERKTIFGLTARHLKVTQEMESSADSCNGANKTKMEIDGWYVDFSAEFNCPDEVTRTPYQPSEKPDCKDRIIFRGSGGKSGFLLNGTMTFYDASGNPTMTQTTETLELSRSPLTASLFDVPADYKLASSQQDLYSMPSMTDMVRQQQRQNNDAENPSMPANSNRKNVGLNITYGSETKVNQTEISQYLQNKLRDNNLNARIGAGGGGLDYILNVEVKKAKETKAGKIGGIFGKVTGVDTKGQTEIELVMTLVKPNSNNPVTQSRVAQKYDGSLSEAVKSAIDDAFDKILGEIEN
jgi:hypothetical protein